MPVPFSVDAQGIIDAITRLSMALERSNKLRECQLKFSDNVLVAQAAQAIPPAAEPQNSVI